SGTESFAHSTKSQKNNPTPSRQPGECRRIRCALKSDGSCSRDLCHGTKTSPPRRVRHLDVRRLRRGAERRPDAKLAWQSARSGSQVSVAVHGVSTGSGDAAEGVHTGGPEGTFDPPPTQATPHLP